jgi:hypothetical protein
MNRALGEIPLTVKLRTGVKEGRNTAHKLMPRISAEWNVAAMTVSPTPATFSLSLVYDTIPIPPPAAVARADETTAIHKVGGLGLHPRMRQRCSRT